MAGCGPRRRQSRDEIILPVRYVAAAEVLTILAFYEETTMTDKRYQPLMDQVRAAG
jgi:hypothetical protein